MRSLLKFRIGSIWRWKLVALEAIVCCWLAGCVRGSADGDDEEQPGVEAVDYLEVKNVPTKHGDLICIEPEMDKLRVELLCGALPDSKDKTVVLAFAGAFTGQLLKEFKHSNIAGDHVSEGIRHKGYRCSRNTGTFTWSKADGPGFHYKDYSTALDRAAANGSMAFTQEMLIHEGKAVKTKRSANNANIFSALCLNKDGELAVFESKRSMKFGKFVDALLSLGVREAIYTDMGPGWNFCFYRKSSADRHAKFLHNKALVFATNFVVFKPY